MEITLEWHKPIVLRDGRRDGLIYTCALEQIPAQPGIYMFSRRFGRSVEPLYVGKAQRLRARIKNQLNNLRLMNRIEAAQKGPRVLLLATVKVRGGQRMERLLDILERAYIEESLQVNSDLLNNHHSKPKFHSIESNGKKEWHAPFRRGFWVPCEILKLCPEA